MIYSPCRSEDMRWRLELLDQMEDVLVSDCPVTAKEIGIMTKLLDDRIKNHNYAKEDKVEILVKRIVNA